MILSGCRRTSCTGLARLKLARCYQTAGCDLDRPFQSYISTSNDPFLNLSIEHHLLQKSSKASVVLLLYVNRPCVVIGRNQNPWTEVNLPLLRPSMRNANQPIDLVRRRSGGGTVFHDSGNVNWTVISPADDFTRDKHAEMVTRALRRCGVQRCRVNERHDIVLDQGGQDDAVSWGPDDDTHKTPWQENATRSVKVSGSAYKLTRGRALHHGTALLNSPNLGSIHDILTAPGKTLIDSKGVASVSSPVANIGLANDDFIGAVQDEFWRMYAQQAVIPEEVGESWSGDQDLCKGLDELKSPDWTFLQTPRFTAKYDQDGTEALLDVKNGAIESVQGHIDLIELSISSEDNIIGQNVHEVKDWPGLLAPLASGSSTNKIRTWANWLQKLLPVP